MTPKTFKIKSFGCQMNVYDGERMAELMAAEGLVAAQEAGDADLVVLNTCHIRERATEKVYSDIGRLRKDARKAGRDAPMIAVAGCVAQAEGEEIVARAKVDVVVGPQAYHNLPKLVADAAAGMPALDTDLARLAKFGSLPARRRVGPAPAAGTAGSSIEVTRDLSRGRRRRKAASSFRTLRSRRRRSRGRRRASRWRRAPRAPADGRASAPARCAAAAAARC